MILTHIPKSSAVAFVLLLTACGLLTGCRNPSFTSAISPEQEKTIGDWAAAQIQSESTGPTDPAIVAEVGAITKRLDAAVPEMGAPRILISDSDSYAVASLPGGWVVISARTVTLLGGDPDALAGLLAHEYAHVKHNDAVTEMTGALGSDSLVNMTTQGKYTDTANVAVQLMNFNHTPEEEYRADADGVLIAAAAGYDPHGIDAAIATLQAVVPITDAQWLTVHPVTSKRMRLLANDIESCPAERKSN